MDYTEYFKLKTRDNGEEFYYTIEETPTELCNLIRAIHEQFDSLPNDWIYYVIYEAFENLKEDYNCMDEFCEPDIYTRDLIKWLDNGYSINLCEEAEGCSGFLERIMQAQGDAKQRIYEAVNEFLRGQGAN